MLSHRNVAVKRQREHDDNTERYRPLTPYSSIDEPLGSSLPPNKRNRQGGDGDLGYFPKHHGDEDELMSDVDEALAYSISNNGYPSPIEMDHTCDTMTFAAAAPIEDLILGISCGQIGFVMASSRYAVEVDQVFRSRSKRYTVPGTAYSEVKACIDGIAQHINPHSSYHAKFAALEALQDIALSILRADRSRQAKETRAHFAQDDCISQLMLNIIQSMSNEEKVQASEEATVQGSTLARSLQYVHEKAVEEYLAGFYDLSLVLEALKRNDPPPSSRFANEV